MGRFHVLITAPRAQPVIDRYERELAEASCDISVSIPLERFEEQEILPLVANADGIICGDDRITDRVLSSAPRLRVISKWGTGIDSIDLAAAKRRGIAVCNSPGAFADPVADSVFGYLLLFARQLDRMAGDMRAGLWQRLPLLSLSELTLGIVGLGDIGMAVARRAAAFNMSVLGCVGEGDAATRVDQHGIRQVPLERLLTESDVVTLHADLRAGNRHLIDARRLALMKPSAVLVNTARGALVDERALIRRLEEGQLGGAALDVFEEEPLPSGSPLRRLGNVYLAPHNANASAAAAEKVHKNTIRNLLDVLCRESRS